MNQKKKTFITVVGTTLLTMMILMSGCGGQGKATDADGEGVTTQTELTEQTLATPEVTMAPSSTEEPVETPMPTQTPEPTR